MEIEMIEKDRTEIPTSLNRLRRVLDLSEQVLVVITALMIISLMLVSDISVIGRYLFDAPIPASFELVVLIFIVLMIAPLGYVQRVKGHIGVEFLSERMSPRNRILSGLLVDIVLFVFLVFFTYQCIIYARHNWGEFSIGVIPWPYWPALIFLPLGVGSCGLRVFVQIFENISTLRKLKD